MYDKLTENDIKKMQEEIDYRKLVVRPKELEAVKEARAQGDLSENFEYKAAKQDKNRNESRIRYLEKMIKTAHVISDTSKDDEVGIFFQKNVKVFHGRTIPSRFTSKKMMRQKPTNLSPPFVVILSKDTSVSTRH